MYLKTKREARYYPSPSTLWMSFIQHLLYSALGATQVLSVSYGTDSKRKIQLVGGSKRSDTLPGFSWLVSGKPATESPILCILSMLSH